MTGRWSEALACALALVFWAGTAGCASSPRTGGDDGPPAEAGDLADVIAVEVSGDAGGYVFSVAISSPDSGCERYADWWEVVRPDGELVYRRILAHSHVNEQPFTRNGSPVAIAADDQVIVRAHMNPGGYGGAAMRGSATSGFEPAADVSAGFAPGLASADPLPDGCAF